MSLKVFVIDDEECIRDSIGWFLTDLGYDVVTATEPTSCNVYKGHDCSQEHPCGHALIIDHNMPGMTGIEFIERLMSRGCKGMLSNMLVISGDINPGDIEKATGLGCMVAQKPVTLDFLKKWLEHTSIVGHPQALVQTSTVNAMGM